MAAMRPPRSDPTPPSSEGAGDARSPDAVRQDLVVPGSGLVKAQAEAEGLDLIFKRAGFEWREPGCSMYVGMNSDLVAPGGPLCVDL